MLYEKRGVNNQGRIEGYVIISEWLREVFIKFHLQ